LENFDRFSGSGQTVLNPTVASLPTQAEGHLGEREKEGEKARRKRGKNGDRTRKQGDQIGRIFL
jgi:hypothetical protein